jgi:hypothetical protein
VSPLAASGGRRPASVRLRAWRVERKSRVWLRAWSRGGVCHGCILVEHEKVWVLPWGRWRRRSLIPAPLCLPLGEGWALHFQRILAVLLAVFPPVFARTILFLRSFDLIRSLGACWLEVMVGLLSFACCVRGRGGPSVTFSRYTRICDTFSACFTLCSFHALCLSVNEGIGHGSYSGWAWCMGPVCPLP